MKLLSRMWGWMCMPLELLSALTCDVPEVDSGIYIDTPADVYIDTPADVNVLIPYDHVETPVHKHKHQDVG